jgi:predicted AlkP superfamily phosphohydrolase/phosphomutase
LAIHLDIYEYLVKKYKPYFTSFYLNQIDAFGHLFWRYYEPELFPGVSPEHVRKYGDVVPYSYEIADRALGRLLELTNDDTLVVVLSDHGFQPEVSEGDTEVMARVLGNKLLEALELSDEATYVNYCSLLEKMTLA